MSVYVCACGQSVDSACVVCASPLVRVRGDQAVHMARVWASKLDTYMVTCVRESEFRGWCGVVSEYLVC